MHSFIKIKVKYLGRSGYSSPKKRKYKLFLSNAVDDYIEVGS